MKFTSIAVTLLSITGALAIPVAEPQIKTSELEERQGYKTDAALAVIHGASCAYACQRFIDQSSAVFGACVAACCQAEGGVATFDPAAWFANGSK